MILIADSGSTKTDWALAEGKTLVKTLHTQGINPVHLSENEVRTILRDELLPQLQDNRVNQVFFYGSGVRPTEEEPMRRILSEELNTTQVEAKGDLLGAARALCGHEEGLACILGTGANSCYYDGERIVQNIPPLGYILGDEGSGAVLGVRLLNALYKRQLPDALRQEFESEYGMSLTDIINRVYRQPLANRFLASLSPFVHGHLHVPAMSHLVINNFREFIQRNIVPYGRPDLPLSAVGSIAYYYRAQLRQAAEKEGVALGRIERSPIQALIAMT